MIIYFDTETSGLAPGQICQLSYIMQDKEGITSRNFFYSVDYVEPGASMVNRLTVPLLEELSGGAVFGDNAALVADDFAAADLVIAHNITFDRMFMTKELTRAGYAYTPGSELCSMRFFTNKLCLPGRFRGYKNPSLAELAAFFNVTDSEADDAASEYFGGSDGAHDARHDTAKMFLALQRAKDRFPDFEKILLENL